MAFCINCGSEIVENAKFCQKCGHPTEKANHNEEKRKQEFVGKIYKCPNCGEELKSFEIKCPACGHELRGAKASNAVKEFALKLEAIESRREYEKPKGIFDNTAYISVNKTDEQKINLIKSFSVPNNREDMLEFMILASSNVNFRSYDSFSNRSSKGEVAISDAWIAKMRQVYDKARVSCKNSAEFIEIQRLYDECMRDIRKTKKKGILKYVFVFAPTFLLAFGWIPIIIITSSVKAPIDAQNENERLESIVLEVEDAVEKKEYKRALLYADSIEYSPEHRNDESDNIEKKWEIEKELLIDKIIEAAKRDGIDLQYIPLSEEDENIEPSNEDSEEHGDKPSGFISGFKNGFNDAMQDSQEETQTETE